jgi:hypothetical protein
MMSVQGNPLVPLVMVGWVPLAALLFRKIPARQAAAAAFVLGFLFLPVAKIPMKGLPDLTKVTICCAGILAGAWIYDRDRLLAFRLHPIDIPMLLWCSCPLLSSVANGLGAYDGLSESMYQSFTWGLPYFVARIYFGTLEGLNTLAITVFVGGLVYIPFCIEEVLMSPQLHRMLYGFHQHSFLQTMRGGGFRPMVFMEHGLMVAMWMISAAMLGIWLTYAGVIPRHFTAIPYGKILQKLPIWLLLLSLLVTTVLMKSTGAFVLFLVGLSALYLSNKVKTTLIIWFLLAIPPTYIIARSTGIWNGENLSSLVAEKFSARGGQSLQFRFDNEKILVEKALDGTFFGWGGWNRSRVFDEDGKDISITDGLWIITLGTKGVYGLILLTLVILLPVLLLLHKSTPAQWNKKEWSSVSAMSILLLLYMIDNLLNGMVNPVFMLFNGGICGLLATREVMFEEERQLFQENVPAMSQTRYLGSAMQNSRTKFITSVD